MSQATQNGEFPPPQPQQQQQMQQQQPPLGIGGNYSNDEPEVQLIQLPKFQSGMGLSIVAAKGVGKDRLGIYVKAVVEGGAAHHDGRLQVKRHWMDIEEAVLLICISFRKMHI